MYKQNTNEEKKHLSNRNHNLERNQRNVKGAYGVSEENFRLGWEQIFTVLPHSS